MKVFLTGASSGIGYKLALKLAESNNIVYLGVHTKEEVRTTIERIKNYKYKNFISVMKFDILSKKDRYLIKKLDPDCLVNLSAIGIGGSLINMSVEDIRKNFEVNFFSVLELVKFYLLNRKDKFSKVVIVSSIASLMPLPYLGSYCSSKAALSAFFKSLHSELKDSKINASIKVVEPGTYKTGFNQIMIDNKENLDSSLFFKSMNSINNRQRVLFSLIEYRNLNSIVNKIYKSIISSSDRFIYRAPLLQSLFLKLYMLLIK